MRFESSLRLSLNDINGVPESVLKLFALKAFELMSNKLEILCA